ncbi:hypothetical protein [Streptomyces sp. B6B3]|uniref:hypothetical protein n=1 Tax=Streptomyces sp. B6B3 TaxID=3153570 RepID=UPI00325D8F38
MHNDDTDIGERLGLLADTAVRGPAPVDELVRGGRRRRARRRVAVGTAAVLAVAVAPLAAASLPSSGSEPTAVPPAAESAASDESTQSPDPTDSTQSPYSQEPTQGSDSAAASGIDPTVVEPYEQIALDDGMVLALLPGGERYAVAPADAIDEEIARAEGVPEVPLPEAGYFEDTNPERPYAGNPPLVEVVSTEGVERIVFETAEGETRDVELLTLPGDPGWAVFYVEFEIEDFDFTVSTWDSDGNVIGHGTYVRAADETP